jgi:hypothetical protein
MPPVPERRPASFGEFVALAEEQQSRAGRSLWFRGSGRSDYRLLPSLYRHRIAKSIAEFQRLEADLMMRFRQRSMPFVSRPLSDDWDLLFFKQHYGVPTRLLDWTENPFIGLFFAIMSGEFKGKFKTGIAVLKFSSDSAVWILDPVKWNRHALRHQGFDRGILTPADDALQSYRPLTKYNDMNIDPVAMYGAHNSPRIVAQRGAFTIFGKGARPMEDVYSTDDFPPDCLTKVVLGHALLSEIRSSLLRTGITESVVFPDLDGLSKEIRRDFKFDF